MPTRRAVTELYKHWCEADRTRCRRKMLWRLSEREDGRGHVLDELPGRVLNHYVSDDEVEKLLEALDYREAAKCIRTLLPKKKIGRSGDLGEILAVEFVEERLGYEVPVRKLRDKDHREMAMRSEDVIGVALDDDDRLTLLKGEARPRARRSCPGKRSRRRERGLRRTMGGPRRTC